MEISAKTSMALAVTAVFLEEEKKYFVGNMGT